MINIEILCGIPASGKSHYANEQSKNNIKSYVKVYDIDNIFQRSNTKTIDNVIKYIRKDFGYNFKSYILDGLFTCENDYVELVKGFKDCNIVFHYWIPDIDLCLYNDKYRREQSSMHTINNIKIDKPDIKKLKLINHNTVTIIHTVMRKSDYQMFKDKYKLRDTLTSQSWCLGGVGRSYTGEEWDVNAEPQLVSFAEFDDLLEKLCPDIKFMQYKKIYNECVRINTKDGGDYYSSVEDGYYECNNKKLFDMLNEYGLVDIS